MPDNQNACGTCRHFIGGGDWNLCCDLKYDLCYDHTEACSLYEYDAETVKRRKEQARAIADYVRRFEPWEG